MQERVEILKKLYPNYLIVIKVKDKIKFIGIDKKIVDTFGYLNLKNTNKLLLDNLAILKIEEYSNSQYEEYYIKARIIELINIVRKEMLVK